MFLTVSILLMGACVVSCDPLYKDSSVQESIDLRGEDFLMEEPRASKRCRFGGKKYQEGDTIDRPAKNASVLDAKCEQCTCSKGKFTDCFTLFYCDTGHLQCDKYITPPGECCPVCKPKRCGKRRNIGDKWERVKSEGICSRCECIEGRKERCENSNFACFKPAGCQKTVKVKDKCCPECVTNEQQTTTNSPTFIIIDTEETPTPTWFNPFNNDDQEV